MSTTAAIVNLGAQLVVFITAASLFLVAVARPDFLGTGPIGRRLLQGASVALAASAVVQGAVPDVDASQTPLVVARWLAIGLLLLASLDVSQRAPRTALVVGAAILVLGEVVRIRDFETAAELARGLGALAIGATAALAARRSIAMRIATASTVLLVVVVLVLSAVLSVVITGNISSEALERTEERARIEAGIVAQQSNEVIGQADFLGVVLTSSPIFRQVVQDGNYETLQDDFESLRSDYRQVDFMAYVDGTGVPRVVAGLSDAAQAVELGSNPVVVEALGGADAASVERLGDGLVALAATPVEVADDRGAPRQVGVVVAGTYLGRPFLAGRLQEQRGTEFTLVTSDGVVASTATEDEGAPPELAAATGDALADAVNRRVLGRGESVSREASVGDETAFVAMEPVERSDGQPVAALVVTTESGLVDDTLESLFRTLFFVALVALALAFVFAVLAGARVAAPVRRLTDAAQRVAEGDLQVRAGIEAVDEIGTLGTAFDTMTGSIERMTREIQEAAAQTAAILGGMAEGVVATDAGGTVVALNPAAESMLGVKSARAVGQRVGTVVKGLDAAGEPLAERLEAPLRRAWSANGTLSRRRGPLAVAMSASPIEDDDGDLIGRVYVMRDIQAEAEVESMKSEFLANISHELRTPLTPIKGYAEMMMTKNVPDDRRQQFLGTILEGAERLERYVDVLVHFSAMEAGRFELQLSEVDVSALVDRVADRWRSRIHDHRVDTKVSSRLPRVSGDARLLERVLNELVDNAVKYSPDGGTITMRARARGTGAARRVEVSVTDEGIGIDTDELEAVFTEFIQLDGSSTRRFGGLGLGLSFVNRVVEAHQGTLQVDSKKDRGSVFTISLPPASKSARKTGEASSGAAEQPAANSNSGGRSDGSRPSRRRSRAGSRS